MNFLNYYIKWGFESRLKLITFKKVTTLNYIKWGFESRLKHEIQNKIFLYYYIKWGFESRLKLQMIDIMRY